MMMLYRKQTKQKNELHKYEKVNRNYKKPKLLLLSIIILKVNMQNMVKIILISPNFGRKQMFEIFK